MKILLLSCLMCYPDFPIPPEVDRAVNRGLEYLVSQQLKNGSIGKDENTQVATTAFSGMAFLSEGSTPREGKYSKNLKGCVNFILDKQKANGLLSDGSHATYEHGFALLFLCEVYGQSEKDADIKDAITRGIRLLTFSQDQKDGGWRYDIPCHDSDLSVTVCQIMALRAAKNVGFKVPVNVINKSIDYVKRLQNDDGSFSYMKGVGHGEGFARTASALVALHSVGIYEGPIVDKARRYMWKNKPTVGRGQLYSYFLYSHYYAAGAAKQQTPAKWREWYTAAQRDIMLKRDPNGLWFEMGQCDGTAMACIILQMPNEYLPIFQR